MVSATRTPLWSPVLQHSCRHLVCGVHICGTDAENSVPSGRIRYGSAENYFPCIRDSNRRRMAGTSFADTSWHVPLAIIAQGHTKLPDYVPVGQFPKTPLRDLFTAASADCLNILSKCLIYDPHKRISAKDVSLPSHGLA
jgi:hypothetical protein